MTDEPIPGEPDAEDNAQAEGGDPGAAPRRRPLSEAALAARRANARRSTGPRTPQGKARSRLNGVTHGLRAELAVTLPGEDPGERGALRDALDAELNPGGSGALALCVAELAEAALKLRRARRAEEAATAARLAGLDDERGRDEADEVDRLVAGLAERPAPTVAALEATARGCRWLAGRWAVLVGRLEAGLPWDAGYLRLSLNLSGLRPGELFEDPTAYDLSLWMLAISYATLRDEPRRLARLMPEWSDEAVGPGRYTWRFAELAAGLPEPAEARDALLAFCRERLDAALDRLDAVEARAGSDRALAADRALVDVSRDGALRLRYLGHHRRAFHSTLQALDRLRRTLPPGDDDGDGDGDGDGDDGHASESASAVVVADPSADPGGSALSPDEVRAFLLPPPFAGEGRGGGDVAGPIGVAESIDVPPPPHPNPPPRGGRESEISAGPTRNTPSPLVHR